MQDPKTRFVKVDAASTPGVAVHPLAIPAFHCSLKLKQTINMGLQALMDINNNYRIGDLAIADGVFLNGIPTLFGNLHVCGIVANTGQLLMREYLNVSDDAILKMAASHLSTEMLFIPNTPDNMKLIWSAIQDLPEDYMNLIFGKPTLSRSEFIDFTNAVKTHHILC